MRAGAGVFDPPSGSRRACAFAESSSDVAILPGKRPVESQTRQSRYDEALYGGVEGFDARLRMKDTEGGVGRIEGPSAPEPEHGRTPARSISRNRCSQFTLLEGSTLRAPR
jgi:hypothetical protein